MSSEIPPSTNHDVLLLADIHAAQLADEGDEFGQPQKSLRTRTARILVGTVKEINPDYLARNEDGVCIGVATKAARAVLEAARVGARQRPSIPSVDGRNIPVAGLGPVCVELLEAALGESHAMTSGHLSNTPE